MIELMFIFFYVGLFTIGGGLVAIPLIQQQVVGRGLISLEEFYSMVAIAESTPGPIGINIATFVGYSQYGIIGALLATISFIIPSFIIVSILANLLKKHREKALVVNWFLYIKAAIVGLIAYTLANVSEYAFISEQTGNIAIRHLLVFLVLVVIYYILRKNPLLVIGVGAIFGFLFL